MSLIMRRLVINHLVPKRAMQGSHEHSTLKVESFAGRNFRDFANFSIFRESLYPRNRSFQVVRESLYPRNFLKFLKN